MCVSMCVRIGGGVWEEESSRENWVNKVEALQSGNSRKGKYMCIWDRFSKVFSYSSEGILMLPFLGEETPLILGRKLSAILTY